MEREICNLKKKSFFNVLMRAYGDESLWCGGVGRICIIVLESLSQLNKRDVV